VKPNDRAEDPATVWTPTHNPRLQCSISASLPRLFLLRAHDRAGLSPNAEQVLNDYSFPQNNRKLEVLLSCAIAQAGRCAPDEETIIQPDLLWRTQWTAEFYRKLFNLFKFYPALWMLSRSNNWLERFNDFIFAPGFVLFNALLLLGPQTRDQLPALSIS